ncbi:Beta-barrel assembly machine subunit BamA [Pseudoroseicyclus aestuarii]|uniref:Outer membrane protein assembly factor BamA n=2 Tax=Pseudoroseicyclus aestuarii TaxID=1795041 RepID=A0A318T6W3_9RHOB|nr:Beta-barrel assembly machine subunit BamA [Pseudoroseicyclus aestuarii]
MAMAGALAAATLVAPAWAQSFRFDTVQVTGNQRIEPATILSYAGITRGEAVSAGALNDAAQQLRQTGLFESVDVVPQGNTLTIDVTEWPTINRISFEGNSRIDDEELAEVTGSIERRVYSPEQAEIDTAAIVQAYAERGRIDTVVMPSIIRRADNRVDLVFDIAEGGVTEIERISFVGNRSFGERRLRAVLATRQAGLLRQIIQSDTLVEDRLTFDRQLLVDFYNSRGFPDARVDSVDASLTRERDAYLITFNVTEGPRYRIGNVSVVSDYAGVDPNTFAGAAQLRGGRYYSPSNIDDDIARMERLAIREGVDFLRVDPEITRNPRDLTLDVTYHLRRGERVFVERIDIEGNNTTLDRVIRNQFRTVEGDPFNPRAIRESAERVRALGYFGDASVNTQPGSQPDTVVIDVDVEEAPTGSLSFGANFSSDDGVALVAGLQERNFLGRGQTLGFDISTSRSNRIFSFDFAEPNFLGRDLRAGFSLDYRSTKSDEDRSRLYDTDTFRISPSFAFPVSENGRLSLYVATEYNNITDVDDDASQVIKNEAEDAGEWTQSIGYTYTFDTRRTGINPTSGVLLRFGQEFGIGDRQFVQTSALASAERRVLGEEVTLRATVEGAHLYYNEGSSRVTDRYFLGSRIMRGFQSGGIGPRDADTDDALGGNTYAVARLESEFPLGLPEQYQISGGAFLDYGSVWDVGETYDADVLYNDYTPRAVVGVSLFWTTPLGPLRFNFTEALMSEDKDETRGFDLTIQSQF